MCGIVGLFIKDPSLKPKLGSMLNEMLITMTDRGPDSAGFAIYSDDGSNNAKITIQSENAEEDFAGLDKALSDAVGTAVSIRNVDTHAVLTLDASKLEEARKALKEINEEIRVMSAGESIEIYKEVGLPEDVAERFGLDDMSGSHGIGHTRMATESKVTTNGAHPYSTGDDQCMVHNGSLSNHNRLRKQLQRDGMVIESENDTEVGAAYISHQMKQGSSLDQALESSLDALDGFFTFVVGTKDGFGVVRDPIACKPAVLAETDEYVAFGSEYRALVGLPRYRRR